MSIIDDASLTPHGFPEIVKTPRFDEGSIVQIVSNTPDVEYFQHGPDETIILFEKIDLVSFPSYNDFHGSCYKVKIGSSAVVLDSDCGSTVTYNFQSKTYDEIFICKIMVDGVIIEILNTLLIGVHGKKKEEQ